MSLGPITQHEWLNRNSLRAFPVMEDCRLLFNYGDDMPNSILVDMFLAIALPGPMDLCVDTVSFTMRTVTVVLSSAEGGQSVGYATAILGSTPPNSAVPIKSPSGQVSGTVSFGKILDVAQYSDYGNFIGTHKQAAGVMIDQRCYICTGKPVVESISVDLQDGFVNGNATISLGGELRAEISELLINGVSETQVELFLANPEEFLPDCYPKYIDPLCYCGQRPVITVNGVPRDEDGDLGIDITIAGEDAEITNEEDLNLLQVAVEKPKTAICVEDPIVPDSYGRLGPNFSQDCPPSIDYGLGELNGPACTNPPPRPPPQPAPEE